MKTKSIQVFFCFFFLILLFIYSVLLLLLRRYPLHYGLRPYAGVSEVAARSHQAKRRRHIGPWLSAASIASPFLTLICFPLSSLPSLSFSFSTPPSPSISTSADFDGTFASTLILLSIGFLGLGPPLLTTACLSLRLKAEGKKKLSLRLSINVLSLDFLFPSVYLSVWCVGSCLGAPGLLSAKCWFLFFCQFTCLSERLRLDVST